MNGEDIVTVIIPVRNESNYIGRCLQSIMEQDYPIEKLEIIVIDGMSNDKTQEFVNNYHKMYPDRICLLENPNLTVPFAMNEGIRNAIGKYIIRFDAHSYYPYNYISKCVLTLIETSADNVGGLAITKGEGIIGNAFAHVLSSKFGVGNSGFRTNVKSGYTDTVPFGAFKKETFEKYGLYDERLTRNQDYELNYRIRKNGGKIYLNSDIKLVYYCRNTISGILRQSYENGKWNLITSKLCPGTMSLRHFAPLIFLLTLIAMPAMISLAPTTQLLFILELVLYLTLDLIFSIKPKLKIRDIVILLILFPLFHISYGIGSLMGLVSKSIQ